MRHGYRLSTQPKQEVKQTIHEGKPTLKGKQEISERTNTNTQHDIKLVNKG